MKELFVFLFIGKVFSFTFEKLFFKNNIIQPLIDGNVLVMMQIIMW